MVVFFLPADKRYSIVYEIRIFPTWIFYCIEARIQYLDHVQSLVEKSVANFRVGKLAGKIYR